MLWQSEIFIVYNILINLKDYDQKLIINSLLIEIELLAYYTFLYQFTISQVK